MRESTLDGYITIGEMAEAIGCEYHEVYRAVDECGEELGVIRPGYQYLVPEDSMEDLRSYYVKGEEWLSRLRAGLSAEDYVTTAELADRLNCTRVNVAQLIREVGEDLLGAVKVAGKWFLPREMAEAIERHSNSGKWGWRHGLRQELAWQQNGGNGHHAAETEPDPEVVEEPDPDQRTLHDLLRDGEAALNEADRAYHRLFNSDKTYGAREMTDKQRWALENFLIALDQVLSWSGQVRHTFTVEDA